MNERIYALPQAAGPNGLDSNPDIRLSVTFHDTFTISLLENAGSTGYTWSPSVDSTGGLDFKERVYEPPARPMPGAHGTAHFSFEALKPGTHTITFELRQSWQSKEIAAKTFIVEITVSA